MFVVNPSAHADSAALLGRVRTFGYQAALVRKRGIKLPLLLVSYLQTSQGADPWFSWEQGEAKAFARDNNQCATLDEWQQQAVDTPSRAARLHACVQLNSVAQWLHDGCCPASFSTTRMQRLCTRSKWSRRLPMGWKGTCGANGLRKRWRWSTAG